MRRTEQWREVEEMATLEEIAQEKQRIAERLARLDADRVKLADQLNELEIAERVLSRFGKGGTTIEPRRRGRPARTAAPGLGERRTRSAQPAHGVSMSDAALKAVEAHPEGATAADVLTYLSRELGMTVRPNHLGIALQRHRRAGRLENRDSRWFLPHSAHGEMPQAMLG
jgi:hypothetical protein